MLDHKALELKILSRKRVQTNIPHLWFMTNFKNSLNTLSIVSKLPKGSGVILRDYNIPNRASLANSLSSISKKNGLKLLIGDDPCLALKVNADGVHWPQSRLKFLRFKPPKKWIITTSAHDFSSIKRATSYKVDSIFLSPIFKTNTHPNSKFLGVSRFASLSFPIKIPIIALGGLNILNINHLRGLSISGIAGISIFELK